MLFYCFTEMSTYFGLESEEVEASSNIAAAKKYAGQLFDTECDSERPIEVYVTRSRDANSAVKYKVKRTVTITDDARDLGEVEVPTPEED